jgi:hypothetical protein
VTDDPRLAYKETSTEQLFKMVQGPALLDIYRAEALAELRARGISEDELAPYALALKSRLEAQERARPVEDAQRYLPADDDWPVSAETRAASLAMGISLSNTRENATHWFGAWVAVECIEFVLAALAGENQIPFAGAIAWLSQPLASVASVLHNFDAYARRPEMLTAFFALTIPLMLFKTAFFWWWLLKGDGVNAKFLVVSPMTNRSPKSWRDFGIAPIVDKGAEEIPRSVPDRMWTSITILVFAVAVVLLTLNTGHVETRIEHPPGKISGYSVRQIARGGFPLWFVWSFLWTNFASLLQAIALIICWDYWRFILKRRCLNRP